MTALPPHDWPPFLPGWVWLCGAGPGDPGLLTLHALHALRSCDVVVHDALVEPAILDWAPGVERIHAGKRGGKPSPKQRDISLRLIELAREGRRVLRLKGGDPFVFGRGGEEGLALVEAGVPFRVIPGISAGIGGLAYAGIPVTHRDVNQSVTFVTGHDQSGEAPSAIDWGAVARASEVIVIYMGLKHAATIAGALMAAGRGALEPCAIVSEATTPRQRVVETVLGRLAEEAARAEAPAILCVGRAVLLRQALDWAGVVRSADPLGTRGLSASA
ncbi:uroporphyrinogen-III C-methyltransferase [Rubellimicrobium sp. CFH 75288]|uniref:uroporphyrinogen-III C-methyltransferase n=1 Tax=Rubellimicrobium sp. CFH 75288 TaxID=2697034 RepID=UPI0014131602|nr:uroporphyrinogen-III C-methyltransferase [Rubellimicrobium sp. CFH 75288]NAZ35216.1 uroporphyrinogen-III C-methyltransferase [Rubellimicrobium sp. CFH 75288]